MAKTRPREFRTKRGLHGITLAGVDGRSLAARRFAEIVVGIEGDLGGDLTEAQRQLVARAATLAIWAEQHETELASGGDFDPAQYSAVSNTLRRLLSDLGLERRARDVTPTLHEYLAQRAQADG